MIRHCSECKRTQVAVSVYVLGDREIIDLDCGHEA